MAEFISAIVGLVAVGAHVGRKAYQAVEAFKDAPDEFLALSNEIADFRLILNTVEEGLRNNSITPAILAGIDLDTLVQGSRETFDEIIALFAKVQRVEDSNPEVRRRKWVIKANQAKVLQKRVKGYKMVLSSIIQAYTL